MFPRRTRLNLLRAAAVCIGTILAVYTSFLESANDVEHPPSRGQGTIKPTRLHKVTSRERETKLTMSPPEAEKFERILPPKLNESAIINPHPYHYIMRPANFCDASPLVVLFVHSAPRMYKRRTLIRSTWGQLRYHQNGKLKMFFMLGLPENEFEQQSLRDEHHLYGDILQENFRDSYRNLTTKAVGALGWIVKHCTQTPFVVKTDDDAFVNVFSLLAHLSDLHRLSHDPNLLMCRVNGRMPVMRRGKWNVTKQEYPEEFYPPYCAGIAFVMTMDVARALYDTSFRTRNFWVDDAWLTGLVLKNAGIKARNIFKLYTLDKQVATRVFLGETWYQYMFAHLGPIAIKDIWDGMSKLADNYTFSGNVSVVVPGTVVL